MKFRQVLFHKFLFSQHFDENLEFLVNILCFPNLKKTLRKIFSTKMLAKRGYKIFEENLRMKIMLFLRNRTWGGT